MTTQTHKAAIERPNLLMIIVDQERAIQHFPEGWEATHMPALRLLKKHGLHFKNGFCNACMCSPSRSTLFTSLYAPQHGVTDTLTYGGKWAATQVELNPSIPNLAKVLRPHYDVHYRGKWHLNKGGQNKVQAAEKALMSSEVAIYGFKGWIAPDAGEDMKLENFGGGYANHDARYVQEAIDFIQDHQRRKAAAEAAGKTIPPFFLVLSLVNPHDVLSYPVTYKDGGYDDSWLEGDIELPASFDENLATNFKPTAQLMAKIGMDSSLGALTNRREMKNYINFYGKLMSLVDFEMMQLLDLFYKSNGKKERVPTQLAKDTWIVRLADHGELGMTHGGLRQKSYNVYEETMRIPYVFSRAGYYPEGGVETDQMASLIDVLPTLAGLLGAEKPDGIRGKDLSPIVRNPLKHPEITNDILFTFDDIGAPVPNTPEPVNAADRIRCVRTKKWKYARYFRADGSYKPEYEFYYLKGVHLADHIEDPEFEFLDPILADLPYEMANFGNDNFLEKLLKEGKITPKQKQKILAKRQEMADLLAKREEDIYIDQPVLKNAFIKSLKAKLNHTIKEKIDQYFD